MTTITLEPSAFRAVSLAMGKKDIRYYLNGVKIEHNGASTRLIATDGHRMNIGQVNHYKADIIPLIEGIIPAEVVARLCKLKGNKPTSIILTESTVTVDYGSGCAESSKLIDGKFPDYSRVIPTTFSGEPAQYNPEYVADASKSVLLWLKCAKDEQKFSPLQYNGGSPAAMVCSGFIAIVMPLKTDDPMPIPESFRVPLPESSTLKEAA